MDYTPLIYLLLRINYFQKGNVLILKYLHNTYKKKLKFSVKTININLIFKNNFLNIQNKFYIFYKNKIYMTWHLYCIGLQLVFAIDWSITNEIKADCVKFKINNNYKNNPNLLLDPRYCKVKMACNVLSISKHFYSPPTL